MRLFSFDTLYICVVIVLGVAFQANAAGKQSSPDEDMIIGIDVSKYQGVVDFTKVKNAGASYVFIRATDGVTYQDPDFHTNYAAARAAGITLGAYHFYETDDDPEKQLDNYTTTVVLRPGDLPPVIDIEKLHNKHDPDIVANLRMFLNGLEAHYSVKPVIYTGLRFSNKHLHDLGEYPLWIAEYGREEPVLPRGWENWTFWQWSQAQSFPGVTGHVDADRYAGDRASFETLLIK